MWKTHTNQLRNPPKKERANQIVSTLDKSPWVLIHQLALTQKYHESTSAQLHELQKSIESLSNKPEKKDNSIQELKTHINKLLSDLTTSISQTQREAVEGLIPTLTTIHNQTTALTESPPIVNFKDAQTETEPQKDIEERPLDISTDTDKSLEASESIEPPTQSNLNISQPNISIIHQEQRNKELLQKLLGFSKENSIQFPKECKKTERIRIKLKKLDELKEVFEKKKEMQVEPRVEFFIPNQPELNIESKKNFKKQVVNVQSPVYEDPRPSNQFLFGNDNSMMNSLSQVISNHTPNSLNFEKQSEMDRVIHLLNRLSI